MSTDQTSPPPGDAVAEADHLATHEARKAAHDFKDVKAEATAAVEEAKQAGVEAATAAKDEATRLAEEAKQATLDTAASVAEQAKSQTRQLLHERKLQAADEMSTLSIAAADAAMRLREGGDPTLARYVESAGDKIAEVQTYLQTRDLEGVANDVQRFARRRPEIFLGGLAIAGLAAARFLKASTPPQQNVPSTQLRNPGQPLASQTGAVVVGPNRISGRYDQNAASLQTAGEYAAAAGEIRENRIAAGNYSPTDYDTPYGNVGDNRDTNREGGRS